MNIPVRILASPPLSEATEPKVFVPDIIRNYPHFALSLAKVLGVPLQLFAPPNLCGVPGVDIETINRLQKERLDTLFPGSKPVSQLEVDPGMIVISNSIAEKRQPYTVIAPRYMAEFDPHGKKKIIVSLGDGQAGLKATVFAIWFARRVGFSLVFWHTTWRDPTISSDNPQDHMNHQARLVLLKAQTLAEEAHVPYEIDIRSVSQAIADGIVAAAYDNDCCLIVMKRGDSAVIGSHCDSTVERTPIPLMVVG
ncbi:MAG: universal stress protein [Candidatus Magasanikbacteria bacterium]|nr:universal stress protein [Candidatus Magasanikbacteria bacterium]